jgi:hypothetical protein
MSASYWYYKCNDMKHSIHVGNVRNTWPPKANDCRYKSVTRHLIRHRLRSYLMHVTLNSTYYYLLGCDTVKCCRLYLSLSGTPICFY